MNCNQRAQKHNNLQHPDIRLLPLFIIALNQTIIASIENQHTLTIPREGNLQKKVLIFPNKLKQIIPINYRVYS